MDAWLSIAALATRAKPRADERGITALQDKPRRDYASVCFDDRSICS
jgi:hypothetical protein